MPYKELKERNAHQRAKYHSDPEFRRKHNECQERWNAAHAEQLKKYHREWAKRDREQNRDKHRQYEIKRKLLKYGLTVEWYEQKVKDQKGLCAICKKPEDRIHWSGCPMTLAVDHDHVTNKIRGLLCSRCNTRLHEDSGIEWLEKALRYLRQYQQMELFDV